MTVTAATDHYVSPAGYRLRRVVARCDCGVESIVLLNNLRRGNTTNCGCERDQRARVRRTTHGMSTESIYFCWCNMKQRSSPNYPRKAYANVGRDPRWDRFETFVNDMGATYFPGAVLARLGDKGDYTPTNCRWLTKSENNAERNKH